VSLLLFIGSQNGLASGSNKQIALLHVSRTRVAFYNRWWHWFWTEYTRFMQDGVSKISCPKL